MQPNSEGRASQAATAGAWLKNERQQRGLHIAALAVMLKVPQAKLEALEADRFDLLPDATFGRALATAVCRALKVDPTPVLALLPRTNEHGFDVRPSLNQPFRERGAGPSDAGLLALVVRPVVWGPALLLLAAAAVYWIPAGWVTEQGAAAPAAPDVVAAASMPAVEFVPAPAASEPAASAAAQPDAAAMPAAASAPAASAPSPGQEASAPPAAAAGAGLRITATANTWIEVVDAQGQRLLSRELRAGEQQEFAGAAYKVRVGNVSGTRVEWRGAAVDLKALGSNNIARLELK